MIWTDDPVRDAERYSSRCDEDFEDDDENRRPVCCECEREILEDHYYVFDCRSYCPDCAEGHVIWL